MVTNPVGCVMIWDGANPRTITGIAKEDISGGNLCFVSGAYGTATVTSGADSFTTSDVVIQPGASGALFNGVALMNASSGAYVTIATEGTFILTAGGNVWAGYGVTSEGTNAVLNVGSLGACGAGSSSIDYKIGRAITGAGSEGYAVIQIRA